MANTGGKRITNTFRFCHHAIPVPSIRATDRILDATAHLTAAIEGVQEAPSDELAAIQTLQTLLLGKVPPTAPTPPQVHAPRPIIDKEPVEIWSPDEVQQSARNGGANSPTSSLTQVSNSPTSALAQVYTPVTSALDHGYTSAIIEDDSDDESLPPTPLRRSPRSHATPSTTTARTRLHVRTAHMINCVIANHILTEAQLPPPTTTATTCRQGYAFAVHLLQHNELHSAVNASEHFIGAVIDDNTGDMLEYQHLIKSDKYKRIWERSFANELG